MQNNLTVQLKSHLVRIAFDLCVLLLEMCSSYLYESNTSRIMQIELRTIEI